MFQQTFENDYSIADADHGLLHRWKAPTLAPWSPRIPVLRAEEQEDEDEKTTQEIEEEKRKDKKRGRHDDNRQAPQPQKNPGQAKSKRSSRTIVRPLSRNRAASGVYP